jgi:microcystin-dependent protein
LLSQASFASGTIDHIFAEIEILKNDVKILSEENKKLKNAVVAFNGGCPTGWKSYTLANGRFIIGADKKRGLNLTGGEENHRLSEAEMPQHLHSGVTKSGNKSFYRSVHQAGTGHGFNHVTGYQVGPYTDATDTNYPLSNHTHNFTTNKKGGNSPHNNIPPYIALIFCEKTK